jgi:hypothetical protein
MTAITFIAILLFVAGPTLVFFASKSTGTIVVKTALAALGFLLLAIALWLVGALA